MSVSRHTSAVLNLPKRVYFEIPSNFQDVYLLEKLVPEIFLFFFIMTSEIYAAQYKPDNDLSGLFKNNLHTQHNNPQYPNRSKN